MDFLGDLDPKLLIKVISIRWLETMWDGDARIIDMPCHQPLVAWSPLLECECKHGAENTLLMGEGSEAWSLLLGDVSWRLFTIRSESARLSDVETAQHQRVLSCKPIAFSEKS